MSYILDALKKAAEQRSGPPPEVRRLLAPAPVPAVSGSRYITLGVAATGAIVVVAILWLWSPVHEAPESAAKPVASAASAPTASATPPVPMVEERPRVAPPARSRAALATPDANEGRRAMPEMSRPTVDARPPATKPRLADVKPPETRLPEPKPFETTPAEPTAPETTPSVTRPPRPPLTSRPGVISPAPAPPVVTVLPPSSTAPAPATSRGPMTAAATPPRPDTSKLKVEVIVYAEQRPQRWVFINGCKYVEGDAIGDARIEEIQSTGVVLVEDGRRITLRP